MKIIRWPALSLMLACLLAGFFMVGQSGNTVVRPRIEMFASQELGTTVDIGKLEVSVYGSYLAADDIAVIDPADGTRNVFTAGKLTMNADAARFLEKRVVFNQARAERVYVQLHQTTNGGLAFLSEASRAKLQQEDPSMRVHRILSFAADQINPMTTFPALPKPKQSQSALLDELPVSNGDGTRDVMVRGYRLKLPRDYPDLLFKELSLDGSTIELVAGDGIHRLVLREVMGWCTGLSSDPRKHPEPITFSVRGTTGVSTDAWFAVAGTVDVYGGQTNMSIGFAMSNMPVAAVLPFVRAYTRDVDMLNIQSGLLTARGRVVIADGVVQPTLVVLRADQFTARGRQGTGSERPELAWMQFLAVSNSMLELTVPVDNKKPYFHADEAIKQRSFKIELKNVEFKLNLDKDAKKLLDGLIDSDLIKKGLK